MPSPAACGAPCLPACLQWRQFLVLTFFIVGMFLITYGVPYLNERWTKKRYGGRIPTFFKHLDFLLQALWSGFNIWLMVYVVKYCVPIDDTPYKVHVCWGRAGAGATALRQGRCSAPGGTPHHPRHPLLLQWRETAMGGSFVLILFLIKKTARSFKCARAAQLRCPALGFRGAILHPPLPCRSHHAQLRPPPRAGASPSCSFWAP